MLKVKDRLSNPTALYCPEVFKSPPGKSLATTWTLEALKPDGEVYYVTLTLTSASKTAVWARASIGMKVKNKTLIAEVNPKYVTETLSISPYCTDTQTVRMSVNSSFIGTMYKDGFYRYIDGENLIIHCHIFVNELDNPVHIVKKSEVEDNVSPRFDLPKLM